MNPNSSGPDGAAWLAAAVNGLLILVLPSALVVVGILSSDAVRPEPPTLLSSIAAASGMALGLSPIAAIVAWRTYVHARAYRLHRRGVWRGPVESASIAGGLAAVMMLRATASTWSSQPFYLVAGYITFYVAATAIAGLVLGLVLAGTALLVLRSWLYVRG